MVADWFGSFRGFRSYPVFQTFGSRFRSLKFKPRNSAIKTFESSDDARVSILKEEGKKIVNVLTSIPTMPRLKDLLFSVTHKLCFQSDHLDDNPFFGLNEDESHIMLTLIVLSYIHRIRKSSFWEVSFWVASFWNDDEDEKHHFSSFLCCPLSPLGQCLLALCLNAAYYNRSDRLHRLLEGHCATHISN